MPRIGHLNVTPNATCNNGSNLARDDCTSQQGVCAPSHIYECAVEPLHASAPRPMRHNMAECETQRDRDRQRQHGDRPQPPKYVLGVELVAVLSDDRSKGGASQALGCSSNTPRSTPWRRSAPSWPSPTRRTRASSPTTRPRPASYDPLHKPNRTSRSRWPRSASSARRKLGGGEYICWVPLTRGSRQLVIRRREELPRKQRTDYGVPCFITKTTTAELPVSRAEHLAHQVLRERSLQQALRQCSQFSCCAAQCHGGQATAPRSNRGAHEETRSTRRRAARLLVASPVGVGKHLDGLTLSDCDRPLALRLAGRAVLLS